MKNKLNLASGLLNDIIDELIKRENMECLDWDDYQTLCNISDEVMDIRRLSGLSKSNQDKYRPQTVKEKYLKIKEMKEGTR